MTHNRLSIPSMILRYIGITRTRNPGGAELQLKGLLNQLRTSVEYILGALFEH